MCAHDSLKNDKTYVVFIRTQDSCHHNDAFFSSPSSFTIQIRT